MISRRQLSPQLQLVWSGRDQLSSDTAITNSIRQLAKQLVQFRSQGGIDEQLPAISHLTAWFGNHGIDSHVIYSPIRRKAKNLGVIAQAGTSRPPYYLITACLDTASIGDVSAWDRSPTSGYVDAEGWLHGRGSADSKVSVSIFAHVLLAAAKSNIDGTLVFLADSDEHSGRFGAVRAVVENIYKDQRFSGAFIGYPGRHRIMIGARGFSRFEVQFRGKSEHTGAKNTGTRSPIVDATNFISELFKTDLPVEQDRYFSFGPKISVVGIHAGAKGYSVTPHSCIVRLDVRLTPSFSGTYARNFVESAAKMSTANGADVKIKRVRGWPSYRLPEDEPIVMALRSSVEKHSGDILPLEVAGPSNVGNYLASKGVPATCGFGVNYTNIHGNNESADTKDAMMVYRAYKSAIETLMGGR